MQNVDLRRGTLNKLENNTKTSILIIALKSPQSRKARRLSVYGFPVEAVATPKVIKTPKMKSGPPF